MNLIQQISREYAELDQDHFWIGLGLSLIGGPLMWVAVVAAHSNSSSCRWAVLFAAHYLFNQACTKYKVRCGRRFFELIQWAFAEFWGRSALVLLVALKVGNGTFEQFQMLVALTWFKVAIELGAGIGLEE